MSIEYPLMQALLARLNIGSLSGHARVQPCYEYEPLARLVSVNLYSNNLSYLTSLIKGVGLYLGKQLTIFTHPLPVFSGNTVNFFPQSPNIHLIKLDISEIQTLCNKLGMDFSSVYRECEPKPKSTDHQAPAVI